ncbi:hypothetical protein BU23DRAFT_253570 [Bimuria novae-zelandiae CBS 107.79]|uniref:Uncharacterized protein n=1 Tax=Bimuria novae-zelandiae CBS 107.79 TaxID=1447943 RepID=A0A6A5VLU0_9PLEO|nr:hypothetical protein BU23DRAFT_253570 [Bimuria novae-zelandiae CBS 107.79]
MHGKLTSGLRGTVSEQTRQETMVQRCRSSELDQPAESVSHMLALASRRLGSTVPCPGPITSPPNHTRYSHARGTFSSKPSPLPSTFSRVITFPHGWLARHANGGGVCHAVAVRSAGGMRPGGTCSRNASTGSAMCSGGCGTALEFSSRRMRNLGLRWGCEIRELCSVRRNFLTTWDGWV